MAEPETKLARLVNWVRENMDTNKAFPKSDLYSFARANDMERMALDFLYRCRKKQTIREIGANRVVVLVPKGKSLEEFYKYILKILDEPVLRGRPMPPRPKKKAPEEEGKRQLREGKEKTTSQIAAKKEPLKTKEKLPEPAIQPAQPLPETELSGEFPVLADVITERLDDRFKRIDDTVASISALVEDRIGDLEKKVSVVIVKELEKRIRQLETQVEEYRDKAEAFDLIKRDTWELIQALEFVEAEREDVKKVLRKFLEIATPK